MTRPVAARPSGALRATLSGDGRVGPIEERIGRRLVRLVDPRSDEGRELLSAATVDLVGPGGERFGRIALDEARYRLRERVERRLAGPDGDAESEALLEGLRRLDARLPRLEHA